VPNRPSGLARDGGDRGVATHNMRDERRPPRSSRGSVAGVGAVLLVAMSIPVMLNCARPDARLSVLAATPDPRPSGSWQVLAAECCWGALTAVAGALTVPGVAAAFLLLSVPVVAIVGAVTRERLW